jgi:HK97 family phage prohead protease
MHKACPFEIKAVGAADGLEPGQFRALVSVFGNKDSYGDVVMPGAFTNTLADWQASGEAIPVYWSHQMADPELNIGWVVDAQETDAGLEVLAQLDLGEGASPKAALAHRLLKRPGGVRQFSFAYDVVDGSQVEKDGDSYFELRELKLYEVGPTPIGANQATELIGVKAAGHTAQAIAQELVDGLKAGRTLSAKNEATLRDALTALEAGGGHLKSVLAALTDDGKASNTAQETAGEAGAVKAEEPAGVKAEEPRRFTTSPDAWASLIAITDKEYAND